MVADEPSRRLEPKETRDSLSLFIFTCDEGCLGEGGQVVSCHQDLLPRVYHDVCIQEAPRGVRFRFCSEPEGLLGEDPRRLAGDVACIVHGLKDALLVQDEVLAGEAEPELVREQVVQLDV